MKPLCSGWRAMQGTGSILAELGYRSYNSMVELRWARASRRHRIGRAHARHVIATVEPQRTTTASGNPGLLWVGDDDRGVELEIVAAVLPDLYVVVHVMPTALRSR